MSKHTITIILESPACPLAFQLWFKDAALHYRERYHRWSVSKILPGNEYRDLDSGSASLGDSLNIGIYRILQAVPEIAQAIFEDD
jgi:hypothetical protein